LAARPFNHPADTLAFRNETLWTYALDPQTGRQVHQRREVPPEYHLRCFVLARTVKQFHAHACFEPALPPLDEAGFRQRLRSLVARNPRTVSAPGQRVVFPGHVDLHSFSAAWESLCKAELGGAWQSYFQRGHWRMLLPFSQRGKVAEAARLLESVRQNQAPVIHVFTFPALTLNHALVAFAVEETAAELRFRTYDPNLPDAALELVFDRVTREFRLPATKYFIGGAVLAYEVYCGLLR
jgi:hypothetical protein